jgi:hypothetical protein
MRCGLRSIGRAQRIVVRDAIARLAWRVPPIVAIIALGPTAVSAQSLVCREIRRGESATDVARRLTGNSRNSYQAWFQIKNASSRSVPKSQYDRVRAGWRACIPMRTLVPTPPRVTTVQAVDVQPSETASLSASTPEPLQAPAVADVPRTAVDQKTAAELTWFRAPRALAVALGVFARSDLTFVWLGAAIVVPWFGWRVLDDHLARRRTTTIVMRHFADRFVHEFERPLVRYEAGERPLKSRLRCGLRQGRFDILLAPGDGRRYPNLSDHKKNVEYDVARVQQALADASFVSGPLYAQAGWVVVPFQFKAGPNQSGVTCISSF